jgi:hypothetical protein
MLSQQNLINSLASAIVSITEVDSNSAQFTFDDSLESVSVSQSAKPIIAKSIEEKLHKRTVRFSDKACEYFSEIKVRDRITVDCLLEAIVIQCKADPELEAKLFATAKQVSKERQDKANKERAVTMSKNFL